MAMVSVIVPIYNVEKYLMQCVESILKQTYQDLEILLIDDGSTDSSGQICDAFELSDTRVVVVHQENMGLSGARNTGIAHAHGEWITIVDGDDWLDDDAIERMVKEAEKETDCDIFIASFYASYPDREYKDSFFNRERITFEKENMQLLQMSSLCMTSVSKENAATNVGVTWARLYRTAFIKDNHLAFKVGLKRMQDATFHLTAYEYASKVCYLNMPVYHYRLWNGAASKKYTRDFEKTASEIIEEMDKFIEKFSPSDEFMRCYNTKITKLLLETIKLTYAPAANPMKRKDKIGEIRRIMNQERYSNALKCTDLQMLSKKQKLMCLLLRMNLVGFALRMYELKSK